MEDAEINIGKYEDSAWTQKIEKKKKKKKKSGQHNGGLRAEASK